MTEWLKWTDPHGCEVYVWAFFCISLMTDVEYLFTSSLMSIICVSYLQKCLFISFAHNLIGLLVFLLLSCKCSLYILDKIIPYHIYDLWFMNSSNSRGLSFIFLTVSVKGQKALILTKSNLLFLLFYDWCFWHLSKESLPSPKLLRFSPTKQLF